MWKGRVATVDGMASIETAVCRREVFSALPLGPWDAALTQTSELSTDPGVGRWRAFGGRIDDLTPDDLATLHLEAMASIVMSGESWSAALRLVRGDGQPVWVSVTASSMHNRFGQVIGTVCVGGDVAERKHRVDRPGSEERSEGRCMETATC